MRILNLAVSLAFLLACTPDGVPQRYTADRDRMTAVFSDFQLASDLTQPPSGRTVFVLSEAREDSVMMLIQRGITVADSIDTEFLAWLHQDMPKYFREYYIAGQRETVEGLRTDDVTRQVRGNELVGRWHSEFWDANKQSIAAKAVP